MKRKFIIGAIVLLGGIGYLFYTMISGSLTYYETVSAFLDNSETRYDESVRVNGKIMDGSIDWNPQKIELKFKIADDKLNMPVVYNGPIPDNFADGKELTVEGKYAADGVFYATNILMKCPSKYVPAE